MRIASRAGSFPWFVLAAVAPLISAISLDVKDASSIKSAASTIAHGLMTYYSGNVTNTPETIAVLPGPYYWWEAGAMWGGMLDYYHYTKDPSYNSVVLQALLSQVGPKFDYMVPRQQTDEGNDDQAFWGFAIMSAAERNYDPPPSGTPSWLQMTINLWNTQVARWDTATCGGGLKWQIFSFNKGYNYKNSVSNGAFFQISARLARYTGNSTYLQWAEKAWKWETDIGMISPEYQIFDGADDVKNCSEMSGIQWTYNYGIHVYGAAVMYNYTNGSAIWEDRLTRLINATGLFFSPAIKNVMYEEACESVNTCDTDQWSFKAYLSRYLWATTKLATFTTAAVTTLLSTSASAAAQACSGGTNNVTCGAKWYIGGWDGTSGVGQQLSALETIQGLLINDTAAPFTSPDVVSPFPDPIFLHQDVTKSLSVTSSTDSTTQHISGPPSPAPIPVPSPTEAPAKKSSAFRYAKKHIGAVGAVAGLTVGALNYF